MASRDLKGDGLGLPVGSIAVFRCRGKNTRPNTIFPTDIWSENLQNTI